MKVGDRVNGNYKGVPIVGVVSAVDDRYGEVTVELDAYTAMDIYGIRGLSVKRLQFFKFTDAYKSLEVV